MNNELIGLLIGFILTLFVYSYLIGDNPLYRVAVHILVGVSAAYAAVVVINQVFSPILDQIRQEPAGSDLLVWLVPAVLALFLLLRRLPVIGRLGNSTIALLVGVGAAVALIGAVTGTLLPQVLVVQGGSPLQGFLVALLTVCTLFTFQFTGRLNREGEWERPIWQRGVVLAGQAVLSITFGALFTNVFSTSVILLIDRIDHFLTQFAQLLS